MDGNKDEALNCLRIARASLKENNFERARKFVLKSQQMFPTDDATQLLAELEVREQESPSPGAESNASASSTTTNPTSRPQATHEHSSHAHNRHDKSVHNKAKTEATATSSTTETTWTAEDAQGVKTIISSKTHYETLKVSREATEDDIKRAYRKMAVKFHPDKNRAPRADEAFKKISHAYQVLSDPDKRRRYDVSGDDDTAVQQQQQRYYRRAAHGFQEEMTPDELFRAFFGGQFGGFHDDFGGGGYQQGPFRTRVFRSNMGTRRRFQEDDNFAGGFPLQSLLMVLFVVVLSMFASSGMQPSEPEFVFSKVQSYRVERSIGGFPDIKYHVKDAKNREIESLTKHDRIKFESVVLQNALDTLPRSCQIEKQERNYAILQAKRWGQSTVKAEKMPLPSCVLLQKIVDSQKDIQAHWERELNARGNNPSGDSSRGSDADDDYIGQKHHTARAA